MFFLTEIPSIRDKLPCRAASQSQKWSQLSVGTRAHLHTSVCKSLESLQKSIIERLGKYGATHDSQSTSRSGVKARVAQNLNG